MAFFPLLPLEKRMRMFCRGLAAISLVFLALAVPATAQNDEFMKECLVTASQRMCTCISGRIPADQRANAILRRHAEQERQYDQQTGHGRSQGAWLTE